MKSLNSRSGETEEDATPPPPPKKEIDKDADGSTQEKNLPKEYGPDQE